ncbi:hypothetical protein [Streptomyces sp. NPDC096095]|uniref:hypothetical protein n=1 Tax=Streptomyces sp. NPDC096095 TaxID=3155545 RepID=UPI0033303546
MDRRYRRGRGCRRLSDCWNSTSLPPVNRVDGLHEEADRFQAELAAAEQESLEWTIARERVGAVLSAPGGDSARAVAAERPGGAETKAEVRAPPPAAARVKSQVPVWHEGLPRTALSAD